MNNLEVRVRKNTTEIKVNGDIQENSPEIDECMQTVDSDKEATLYISERGLSGPGMKGLMEKLYDRTHRPLKVVLDNASLTNVCEIMGLNMYGKIITSNSVLGIPYEYATETH